MSKDDLDIIQSDAGLIADVRSMIEQTREGVARTVNAGMTLLYWRIGKRIQADILGNERAEYGKEILATLSQELTSEFGKKEEQIELLELDQSGIHVAEYLTALPPRELLEQKLHAAIAISRARLENMNNEDQ